MKRTNQLNGYTSPVVRLMSAVIPDKRSGCWIWTGDVRVGRSHEYGSFRVRGRRVLIHRWAYENWVGPIPDGFHVDHLCRRTLCVNPLHLEAVSPRENVMRTDSPPSKNARKSHCNHGHEYSPENTYVYPDGSRRCRICIRERSRAVA